MEVVVLTLVFTSLLREGMPLFTDLLLSPDEMTWNEAGNYCHENNGLLIVLDSQEKWDDFTAHDIDMWSIGYWTGMKFNDTITCRDWEDYTPWNYNGWGKWFHLTNEPNKCPYERCIRLLYNVMHTTSCGRSNRALCQTESSDTPEADETSSDPTTTDTTGNAAPTATPLPSGVGNATCNQCCVKANQTRQLDEHEREEILHTLKVQLAVNKTNLSAQRRKLISVYDSRLSSVAIGSLACGVLAAIVGAIVVPDIISLSRFVYKRFQIQHKTLPI